MGLASERRVLDIAQAVLAKNQGLADQNRAIFRQKGIFVLNVVSSPGSGKTALLEKTLDALSGEMQVGVVVGDLETDNDAVRMQGRGARVLQINTDGYCHLEANMVAASAEKLGLDELDLLVVENVGNLVCPSTHDLGEDDRVTLISVTEGEDKPLKYPSLFKTSQAVVVTKVDLAEAVEFDRETCLQNIRDVAPQARLLEVSAKRGNGLGPWLDYLREQIRDKKRSL